VVEETTTTATQPLERIIKAEETARKMIEDAEETSKKTVITARLQAKKTVELAEAEYSTEREKKNEQAVRTAEKSTKEIDKKCVDEIDAIKKTAEKKSKSAREFIIKSVLSSAGWG